MVIKKPKNILESERTLYFAMFGESCPVKMSSNLEETENAIEECKAMLDEAIIRSDKSEISFWRKMLQENKVQRREILST